MALVNRIPSEASLSKEGVFTGSLPMQPNASPRYWSAMIKTKFGGDCAVIGSIGAANAAPMNHI